MELNDFVSKTLTGIIAGVKEAQETTREIGGTINPRVGAIAPEISNNTYIQRVAFDIAVTIADGKQTKGGIAVFGGMVNLGAQGESEHSHSQLSRISFTVPIMLPKQTINKTK